MKWVFEFRRGGLGHGLAVAAIMGVAGLWGCGGSSEGDSAPAGQVTDALSAPTTEAARVQAFLDARYKKSDVVHSFHTVFGETIDCIDFFAQPSVKALAARGTPLKGIPQSPASLNVRKAPLSEFEFNGKPDDEGRPRACPAGTVPNLRITPEEILARGGIDAYFRAQQRRPKSDESSSVAAKGSVPVGTTQNPAPPQGSGACTQQFGLDYPKYAHVQQTYNNSNSNNILNGSASFSIFNVFPGVPTNGAHVVAQTWMYSGWGVNGVGCTCGHAGEPACTQSVEAGWLSSVSQYGNASPHFFVYSTNDGYASGCWVNGTCGSTAPTWVAYPGATLTPGASIAQPGQVLGTQHELAVRVEVFSTGWWVSAGIDGNNSTIGYFTTNSYSGSMKTAAQTFQAGGEVYDPNSNFGIPMGSGASFDTGYTQAAAVHDVSACGASGCFSPATGAPFATGGMLSTGADYSYSTAQAGGPGWQNWFYYGRVPSSFWGQNYGYQWSPIGDWASMSFKGECGTNGDTIGTPLIGLSAYPSGSHQAHAVQCSSKPVATTESSCHARPFNPGDNQGLGAQGEWDLGFYKANCTSTQFVQGISQSTSGAVNGILCCPSTQVTQNNCNTQILYNQNSGYFVSNGSVDWDWGYYKAQCGPGQYVAGVSALAFSDQGVVGAPHAIKCCDLSP